jgi:hypothetical protein
LLFVALAVVGCASACQVDVRVAVDVREDGSGVVTVEVGLDGDAVSELGGAADLLQTVKVDDLRSTGWTIRAPNAESNGFTWLVASKTFENPAQAAAVLDEVASGPFRDFRLERAHEFARTRFTFDGTADFTKGIEVFSDPDLTTALDGKPLGQDVETIAQQFGGSLEDRLRLRFTVRLPGNVTTNSPDGSHIAVWRPTLADTAPLQMHAESQIRRSAAVAWAVLAFVAGAALLLYLVVLAATRLRRR